ncbi:outer membrane protein [Methylocystis parvus]|uniref:Porin family protein n=1 Tax=Methylocystis parvus TaxID=134 RepID=A0A6B8M951_9HYPH|nr:outer membrane beta-barrel protein [Methylocystis parvus]QGM99166.1 porin family protein [Methylocystis parvus]WBK00460.1 outer membrane beta-barrel protein [Methylocystis parvus OBBP]
MKKVALSVAALALTAGSALAADLPSRKGPPVLPPPPPPPLWTGFYVGLNAGGGWSSSTTTNVVTSPLGNPLLPLSPFGVSEWLNVSAGGTGSLSSGSNGGFLGGGQIGYNYQFYNSFVVGLEADIQGVATSGSGQSALTVLPTTFAGINSVTGISVSKSLDYIGTVRGRLGWLALPTLLIYGTGGLAYGGVNSTTGIFQQADVPFVDNFGTTSAGAFSDTRVGWTAGGGVEWMFWPNWSAKVEYLYYNLGTVTYSAGSRLALLAPATPLWAHATQTSTSFNGNIVRAGVNYHFNWGAPAPVVAKY